MKRADKRLPVMILFTWVLVFYGSTIGAGAASLPEGLIVQEVFKQGIGAPVGKTVRVQGEVVIMHEDQKEGYRARRDLPLFKRDILVTRPTGRVSLELIDESRITLGSDTKIEINESVYSRRKKSRFTFIRMSLGKARFLVRKLTGLRMTRFKVLTATAIAGIRGTEFVVIDEPGRTIIYSINDPIEVTSLTAPDQVVVLQDSEKTTILEGQLPSEPVPVAPSEIDGLNEYFAFASVPAETRPEEDVEKKTPAGGAPEPAVMPLLEELYKDTGVLVPEEEMVEPEESPEQIDAVITPEIIQEIMQREQQEVIREQVEEKVTETITGPADEWPGFLPPLP